MDVERILQFGQGCVDQRGSVDLLLRAQAKAPAVRLGRQVYPDAKPQLFQLTKLRPKIWRGNQRLCLDHCQRHAAGL